MWNSSRSAGKYQPETCCLSDTKLALHSLGLIVSELLLKSTIERVKNLSNRKISWTEMAAKQTGAHSWRSRFAHAHYGSQVIDRFLYWGDHRNQKSGEIKGSCHPPLSLGFSVTFLQQAQLLLSVFFVSLHITFLLFCLFYYCWTLA